MRKSSTCNARPGISVRILEAACAKQDGCVEKCSESNTGHLGSRSVFEVCLWELQQKSIQICQRDFFLKYGDICVAGYRKIANLCGVCTDWYRQLTKFGENQVESGNSNHIMLICSMLASLHTR
ncbi:hypothetical protein SS50377_21620 [Spironucleus salmonicida]|uniref:Uncharacterized protein n=1 Tax=Spironucleus salmonicida TaxID=348837 RepID=V6LQ26_9EUKA|nr:hypothetical protein SS50377_21620 [Spironucleus salmonicida]|eukprot:EST42864.1 Hypothetical protein SS50377_17487 [Spironucleus salmonicida]